MTCIRLTPGISWGLVFRSLLTITVGLHPVCASAQQSATPFERWVATHALPIATVDSATGVLDLQRVRQVIGSARVVALGEPTHGAHEPLAFRNRLFRYLVDELGFTAIAIESGLPESRLVQDYVAGGPGDARQIVRDNLSWGFGEFQENEALVQWMRQYNANPTHHRKVRFYGMDLSLGGPGGSIPMPIAFDGALSYVARVDSMSAGRLRATFQPLLARMHTAASLSIAEHDALTAAIDDLLSLLERERPAYTEASSAPDYEWGYRNAIAAQQADRMFRLMPRDAPAGVIPPSAWQAMNSRDAAMAENVRWILTQEGPQGRVLVFAHNGHVKNGPTEGGIWSAFEKPATAMGQYLHSALGRDLIIIGTSAAANGPGLPPAIPDSDGVDASLAKVGLPLFLIDLRASSANGAVNEWLLARRSLRANFTTILTVSPRTAFDALMFIDTLTPAHIASTPR